MAAIFDAAGNVLGEVSDYLKQEAQGMQQRQDDDPGQRSNEPRESSGDAEPLTADGSSDSLYGPEGMNASAPDISVGREDVQERTSSGPDQLKARFTEGYNEGREKVVGEEQQQQQQRSYDTQMGSGGEGDEEGSLQDTMRGAKERIDEETRMLKQRFNEGYQQGATAQEGEGRG